MLKEYNSEALAHLMAAIREDKESREWLVNNGYRELAEFWDAYFGIEKSFKWLLENDFRQLAAAVDAASGNDQAKIWLIRSGYRELSAIIDASEGNKTAIAYLLNTPYKAWVPIAHEIFEYNKKKTKKGIWSFLNFGNPFG